MCDCKYKNGKLLCRRRSFQNSMKHPSSFTLAEMEAIVQKLKPECRELKARLDPDKLPKPRLYVKPGESYDAGMVRWRKRWVEYRDYYTVLHCVQHHKGKHFFRAFYGIEVNYVLKGMSP